MIVFKTILLSITGVIQRHVNYALILSERIPKMTIDKFLTLGTLLDKMCPLYWFQVLSILGHTIGLRH